jgi:undecaprenyl-diphosphatase
LGIIEGVTEFLPVSSTAHLRIAESLFGVPLGDSFWKMFTIVIQLGAVLCLPVYFRKRIVEFIRTFPNGKNGDRTVLTHPLTLTMIAFVVTAIPAYLLTKLISANLEKLTVMGGALVIGGAIMWAVDAIFGSGEAPAAVAQPATVAAVAGDPQAQAPILEDQPPPDRVTRHMEQMSLAQSVWIGFCQIFSAVFPGTSRSMATIAGGQLAGLNRSTALEFSFFLSMPTMFAATGYDLLKALHPDHDGSGLAPARMTGQEWLLVGIGFIVSFFVAWAVVAWFMNWVRTRGFIPFAIYRIVIGLAVLIWLAHG